MCLMNRKTPSVAAQTVAVPDNAEAARRGTMEAVRRRQRSGAAANILTGALGIPASTDSNSTMGAAA